MTKPHLVTQEVSAARGRAGALAAGLIVAAGVFAVLPQAAFRTEAIVGIGDAATPSREALVDGAVATAVSKPVISRAAASLNGTELGATEPSFLDRFWVMFGFDRATGRAARLASMLAAVVDAKPGDGAGIVKISAMAADADGSARIATAVAEALLAEQDIVAADLRHRQEIDAAQRLDRLRADADAARRRFGALGGIDVDPAKTRAEAAAQTAAAQARLDVVRSILASGTPPLSDRHDLPQTVAGLQSAYLDLSQQLAKAREIYGDRHTTVISLQDGMRRAAVALTTEWKRLKARADADVAAAHGREAVVGEAVAPTDATKGAQLEEARRAVLLADAAVKRAAGELRVPVDEQAYRLVTMAPVPNHAVGLSLISRLMLSGFGGLLSALLVRARAGRRSRSIAPPAATASPNLSAPDRPLETASFFKPENRPIQKPQVSPRKRLVSMLATSPPGEAQPDQGRREAARELLPALEAISPQGEVAVVLIAANDAAALTVPAALALSETAAAAGHRVLLIEASGARAALAVAAEVDAEPVLVDVFGQLRVALRADTDDGFLYLAPAFRESQRLVAGLARTDVSLVDDLAAEFDLIVIDGGWTGDAIETASFADAFLRVGHHPSKWDDDRFLAAFGVPREAFLGTFTASTFVPRVEVERARAAQPVRRPAAPSATRAPQRPPARHTTMPRRRTSTR